MEIKPKLTALTLIAVLLATVFVVPIQTSVFAAPGDAVFQDTQLFECIQESWWDDENPPWIQKTIPADEAAEITSVYCNDLGITSAAGIENLFGLEELDLSGNKLQTLNLSTNTALKSINLTDNKISSLNLIGDSALEILTLTDNKLSSIDLSSNTQLTYVEISNNSLSNISLRNNLKLENLDLTGNQIVNMDLSTNNSLEFLNLSENQLQTVNLPISTHLSEVFLNANKLAFIDLSPASNLKSAFLSENSLKNIRLNNPKLEDLDLLENQLTQIDLSGEPELRFANLSVNKFTNIDFSKNSLLNELNLANNRISKIDTSKLTSLTDLNLTNNLLSTVNLSNNKLLSNLALSQNRLISIDVSKLHLQSIALDDQEIELAKVKENVYQNFPKVAYNLTIIPVTGSDGIEISGNKYLHTFPGTHQLFWKYQIPFLNAEFSGTIDQSADEVIVPPIPEKPLYPILKKKNSKTPFKDISKLSKTTKKDINWLSQFGITTGISKTKYGPSKFVNRASMATFLRRLASNPKITQPVPSLSDLKKSPEVHRENIKWLASVGITVGVKCKSETCYLPKNTVTRGAMAEFLYKLAGSPEIKEEDITATTDKFSNDKELLLLAFENPDRLKAISWLSTNQITTGITKNQKTYFYPTKGVTRSAMATFLHKTAKYLKIA